MSKISIVSFSARKTGNCFSIANYIMRKILKEEVEYISS